MGAPARLYKYLPLAFVQRVIRRGDFLFRNLSYFRQLEHAGRGDLLEGLHMDRPDNPVRLTRQDGHVWEGEAAFLNSVEQDRILIFCLSTELSPSLFDEFQADACIEFVHPDQLLRRAETVIGGQARFAPDGMLHREVLYYSPNRELGASVTDVRVLPFVKHEAYRHQAEYRLVASLRGGLKLTRRIVNSLFTFDEELARARPGHRHIFLGSLEAMVKVHKR